MLMVSLPMNLMEIILQMAYTEAMDNRYHDTFDYASSCIDFTKWAYKDSRSISRNMYSNSFQYATKPFDDIPLNSQNIETLDNQRKQKRLSREIIQRVKILIDTNSFEDSSFYLVPIRYSFQWEILKIIENIEPFAPHKEL